MVSILWTLKRSAFFISEKGETKMKLTNLFIILLVMALYLASPGQDTINGDTLEKISNEAYVPYKVKDMHETVLEFGEGNLESIKLADNGVPYSIWGNLNKGITASDKLEKCYQFFELHKALLALDKPREELIFKRETQYTKVFTQYYKGIKTDGEHAVHFDFKGGDDIVGYTGSPNPEARQVDVNYEISKEQAQTLAVDYCEQLHDDFEISATKEPELLIKKFEKDYKLTWKVSVNLAQTPFYYCYIDAHTGEVLELISSFRRTR